jgi:hypothetical protein
VALSTHYQRAAEAGDPVKGYRQTNHEYHNAQYSKSSLEY